VTAVGDLLIGSGELKAAMRSGNPPVILDVRWALTGPPGREWYEAGHIPGAAYVDLDTDLASAPGDGGRHPLPAPDVFVAAMRRAGVNNESDVVVYDQNNAMAGARAWWLLRHYGHRYVRVLDGGYDAWVSAGGDISKDAPAPPRGDFDGVPGATPVVDASAATAVARDGVLMDARAAERYRGDLEPVDSAAGHIPGAVSIPTIGNVDADGRFLQPEALRARFAAAGVGPLTTTAAYCGSGVNACHEILALNLAGLDAALYPGSWSGWIADDKRPIATGEETR
jgi:thiosulfate/3-mercaptopyruvate sulfurtransferase